MGMTIAEKILASHSDRSEMRPGEYVWCKIDATSGHMLPALERLGVDRGLGSGAGVHGGGPSRAAADRRGS